MMDTVECQLKKELVQTIQKTINLSAPINDMITNLFTKEVIKLLKHMGWDVSKAYLFHKP
ncbi:hypothetical protein [Bacillus sp. OAE603]|uniref:hypothetical protein n=1 Tax=Gottfriedia sp. OAE603 TaxID=2663872 RepID=UPI00178ABC23